MNGVRTLLPRFLARNRGHVINVASMAAFSPSPGLATYCATKHAVRAYTHSCSLDHRHAPIHWTLACPSAVETPMLQDMRQRRAGVVVFTEKPMPPETIAGAIVDAIREPRREILVPNTRRKEVAPLHRAVPRTPYTRHGRRGATRAQSSRRLGHRLVPNVSITARRTCRLVTYPTTRLSSMTGKPRYLVSAKPMATSSKLSSAFTACTSWVM